jgi:uncharacterized protein
MSLRLLHLNSKPFNPQKMNTTNTQGITSLQETAVDGQNMITPRPVQRAERIGTVDIIRGVAILGILLMNIPSFGGNVVMFLDALRAPHGNADYKTIMVIFSFFEGTMRGLFSMLFGAGMVLFIMNKKDQPGGATVTEYYYRRLAWLVGFGLLHAYIFQWTGEILFFYGLMGMILYPFRNASAKWLWALGLLTVLIGCYKTQNSYSDQRKIRVEYNAAMTAKKEKKTLTPEQEGAIGAWTDFEKNFFPDSARSADEIRRMRGSYADVFLLQLPRNVGGEVNYTYHGLWDMLCMMFIGMALLKLGFLSDKVSSSTFRLTLLLGYGIGIPVGYLYFKGFEESILHVGSYMDKYTVTHNLLYDVKRICLCLGHISIIMLLYRSGWLNWLMKALGSVGQMAFTNYFMQSVFCTFIFFGYGLGYYGHWRFHQLYYVVLGIWIFQLIVSPIWLKYFRFGPFEWAWRSLTYWKKQPMK